eukprot:216859_1
MAANPTPQYVPQQAPVTNVQYVDQFGNPVAAPQVVAQPVVMAQPAVQYKYIDQYGNPVAPPQTQQHTAAAPAAGEASAVYPVSAPNQQQLHIMSTELKARRTGAFFLGLVAFIIIISGLFSDSLAVGTVTILYWESSVHCGWSEVKTHNDPDYAYDFTGTTYIGGDLPDSDIPIWWDGFLNEDISYEEACALEEASDTSWCDTQTAATWTLLFMIASAIPALVGFLAVNPRCPMCMPCSTQRPIQGAFVLSSFFGIIAIIIWLSGDQICLPDNDYDEGSEYTPKMDWGASIICQACGSVLALFAAYMSR